MRSSEEVINILVEALESAILESEGFAYMDPANRLVCEEELRRALYIGKAALVKNEISIGPTHSYNADGCYMDGEE